MKRMSILTISLCISIATAYADGVQYFEHVKSLYEQERYEEAIQGFTACQNLYSDELDVASLNDWIGKCKTKISEKNAAIQAKRQAEIAEAEQRANEAKLAEERKAYEIKQKERAEKKLLFVSSNAFLFDKEYTGMHQAIKGYIANNSEQQFTDNPDMALWNVYVTANAYEYSHAENGVFYSNVVAYIKVINEITNVTIYEDEVIVRKGSSMNYKVAAETAYRNLNKEIGIRILQKLESRQK